MEGGLRTIPGARVWVAAAALIGVAVLVAVLLVTNRVPVAVRTPTPPPAPTPTPSATPAAGPVTSESLRAAIGAEGIHRHLEELARIAAANGGNRAAGSPGDRASAEYVMAQLRAAGYEPRTEELRVPRYVVRRPPVLAPDGAAPLTPDRDLTLLQLSASGSGRARVAPVDVTIPPAGPPSTSGCEAADFAGFRRGDVALLQRGTCPFRVKVERAQAAGAVAAIVLNDGGPGRRELLRGSLGEPGLRIPAFGVSYEAGERLAAARPVVRFTADTVSEQAVTRNVIAETPGGRADRVVMIGAHLDSVAEGPGINDNGSGVGTVLEVARALAGRETTSKVRFAWWAGEELGLLGSRQHAQRLTPAEVRRISLYLNLDMVASPNYTRFVYSPDGAPRGSAAVAAVLNDWFASQGQATRPVDFGPRSDHASFAARGIPVGGLFSGAEGAKRPGDVAGSGGTAGRPLDPCYHQACDGLGNVSRRALDELGDGAAHALAMLAADTGPVDRQRGP
jgi:Zn-dependent M28 family amino/carboxypeptidase